ncbi:class I SAM-dependent methyltransferase [Paenibacillus alvei]|uniref:Methyltransferase type 11 n=1 Tax=Paenibacillus alvei TaxID=44250 RepID=A0A383R7D5_PAEAL|nr:class I SAM-dependent methyltransferase [Paenibacillus alvei]SYX83005.1 Methyltransferase type 11 [Paenibacillus alvei]
MNIVNAREHYESLIVEGNDPFLDPLALQRYMNNWDGPLFYEALTPLPKSVLEIGIGTGRVANHILQSGCASLVGIDISPLTLERASWNLRSHSNVELVHADICDFIRPDTFDLAYSVLTFMHIEDKEQAFRNIYASLKFGGYLILSVSKDSEWFEFNDRKLQLYPASVDMYRRLYEKTGFLLEMVEETESKYATLMKGRKI